MLVLELKKGCTIRIGDDCYVTLQEVSGGRVKLGIAAPRELEIDRIDENGKPVERKDEK